MNKIINWFLSLFRKQQYSDGNGGHTTNKNIAVKRQTSKIHKQLDIINTQIDSLDNRVVFEKIKSCQG